MCGNASSSVNPIIPFLREKCRQNRLILPCFALFLACFALFLACFASFCLRFVLFCQECRQVLMLKKGMRAPRSSLFARTLRSYEEQRYKYTFFEM